MVVHVLEAQHYFRDEDPSLFLGKPGPVSLCRVYPSRQVEEEVASTQVLGHEAHVGGGLKGREAPLDERGWRDLGQSPELVPQARAVPLPLQQLFAQHLHGQQVSPLLVADQQDVGVAAAAEAVEHRVQLRGVHRLQAAVQAVFRVPAHFLVSREVPHVVERVFGRHHQSVHCANRSPLGHPPLHLTIFRDRSIGPLFFDLVCLA
mmetsp:Transcript_49092/g.97130  ORF Transcript_49092/g.97130 Transcript_49092/m.97130 type:complete len:205 (+) Transcript_49092:12-626(+)